MFGVFSVDAAFDGVASRREGSSGEARSGGYVDLLADEIDVVALLGDGMLHLDAGVHLHEVELLVLVEQELDGASAFVVDRFGRRDRCRAHLRPQLFADHR